MATQDFTEPPAISRETATRLNPFIGYASSDETLESVRGGLEFLSLAAVALSDGGSNLTAGGLSTILRGMGLALHFETQIQRGAL